MDFQPTEMYNFTNYVAGVFKMSINVAFTVTLFGSFDNLFYIFTLQSIVQSSL